MFSLFLDINMGIIVLVFTTILLQEYVEVNKIILFLKADFQKRYKFQSITVKVVSLNYTINPLFGDLKLGVENLTHLGPVSFVFHKEISRFTVILNFIINVFNPNYFLDNQ